MNELIALKSPLSVNFEVTPVCDLNCEFCFNAEVECKRMEHPSLNQVKSILDALAKAEVFEVRLFGGEFFIYPYWKEVLEYADSLGFFLSFVSNGTHINKDVVKKMLLHRIVCGAISLHGKKSIHEKITGVDGSFEATLKGIKSCIDCGLGISILYTLTKDNHRFIFETCEWLKMNGINIDEINVGRLTPYGRAKSDWDKAKLSLKDYLIVFSQIEKVRKELDILANFGDAFPLCLLPQKYHDFVVGCWQGTGFGHIDYMGNVRSCSIAKGSYGNILETPLIEIWTNRLAHFRSLKWLPAKCRECDNFCGGGCSASRYNGGMYAPDEFISQNEEVKNE
ncbi:radical SAM protein [Candidatus Parcubacteria bacterium]|nr:radical SAM protein [Candidatus Parcubacteria bacterium]